LSVVLVTHLIITKGICMDFQLSEKNLSDRIALLTLTGRLTAATAPQLRDAIKRLVDDRHIELLFDISGLVFLDSSGLAVIVSGLKTTRELGGWLKLAGITPQVSEIFKLTRLDRVFNVYPSVEDALKGQ